MSLEIFRKDEKLMGKRASIRKERQRLLDAMQKVEPTSEEYAKLNAQLEHLTKSEQNQNGWVAQLGCGIAQTAISAIASTVNVLGVLKHEDRGNIVTTKSLNYAPKPSEHNNSFKQSK